MTVASPADCAGAVVEILVELSVTKVTVEFPIRTSVTESRLVPVSVRGVPPAVDTMLGAIDVNVGAGCAYVNRPAAVAVLLPPGVSTWMFTVAFDELGGLTAVRRVASTTATLLAAVLPNVTVVDPATKWVPVTVTVVPPVIGPVVGEIAVTVGTTWV